MVLGVGELRFTGAVFDTPRLGAPRRTCSGSAAQAAGWRVRRPPRVPGRPDPGGRRSRR